MDGQCKCGLEGEGNVGGGDAQPGDFETTCQIHLPHVEVEKDTVEEDCRWILTVLCGRPFVEIYLSTGRVCKGRDPSRKSLLQNNHKKINFVQSMGSDHYSIGSN